MNTPLEDHNIRRGFIELLARLRGVQEDAETARRRDEVAARSVARNDAGIEQEWLALGVQPLRCSNGRPISLALARTMGMVQIVSEAAE